MRSVNWLFILVGISGLIGVRIFEDILFYDPFLDYFRSTYRTADVPDFQVIKLIGSHLLRFVLNLIFSALIIQGFFKNLEWTKQGLLLMIIIVVLLFPVYLYSLYTDLSLGHLFTFYVRRFLIQPLVLIVLIPLFYYRKNIESWR